LEVLFVFVPLGFSFLPAMDVGPGGLYVMSAAMEAKEYRSPVPKLFRFFERSRNRWKEKCREAKVVIKRLTNGIQALKWSRDRWKALAKQQREELRRLRCELEEEKTLRV
jgi:hypothetical protein